MGEDLSSDLLALLGDDGFFALTEAHAGLRIYVAANPSRSDLPATIGDAAAQRLAKSYPGGYIRVPLARGFRARRYIAAGMSNRDVAKRLGLTESGVDALLKRERKVKTLKRRSKKDPRQLDMF